jgi:hypothetical protein
MVDVASRKCEHEGCFVSPSFNFKGIKYGVRCAEHKLPEMVNA